MPSPADGAPRPRGGPSPPEDSFETALEELFEDATTLAMGLTGAPLAAVALVRPGRNWFKSRGGIRVAETARAIALCSEAAATPNLLVLADVARDPRFRDDPVVRESIRFFAGVPLLDADGTPLAALAAMDREPRTLAAPALEALRALGRRLEREIAARQRAAELETPSPASGTLPSGDAVASAPDGIIAYDDSLRISVWNRALERLTGIPAAEVLGRGALQVFPHLADQGVAELLERALNGETVFGPDLAHRVRGEDSTVWLSATYAPQRDAAGRVVGVVGVLRDVTGRRRAESRDSASDGARTLAAEAAVGLALIEGGTIRNSNPRLGAIFGRPPEEIIALESAANLVGPEDRERFVEDLHQCIEGDRPALRDAFRIVRPDGNPVEIEVSFALAEAGGRPVAVATFVDVTDRRRVEGHVADQAYNDPLTKLPNRVRFLERAAREVAQARRHRRRVAILYLDIDRFKLVNDTWGHGTGDRLLRSLALRLQRRLRQADTIARVGGDEFVILLPDARPAAEMAGVARKLLESVTRPFQLGEQTLRVTASLGVATFPDDGGDPETLLRNADAAMYRAKELGRGTFQLCTPELTSRAEGRLALQAGLRHALEREELVLHYQPILSLSTGRIVGFEALLRWEHPERGLVMPSSFIGEAEETGLIVPIGEWVLKAACAQLEAWRKTGLPDLLVAVNVSARQFREENLVPMVGLALEQAGLQPQHLEVEITESIAMESAEIVVGNLRMLRGMGVGIAIDDFGMGYSSMSYLKRYPITALKIDRSFVSDLPQSAADAGIVRAIVEMAHGTKLTVTAEGVESQDQFRCLQQYGCDHMQGNWVAPPLTPGGVDHLLEEERRLWTET
jgi:diguanylate cyclase (GGDEF)-like protein/PAS domain S-box-containing protein